MDELGEAVLAASQAMVGVRFRAQGFDPATGVDCVGLVWAAFDVAGVRLMRPRGYPLRGWSGVRIAAALRAAGLVPGQGSARTGDVALMKLGAGQFHLGIMGLESLVHAHAGLRRVVETPLDDAVRAAERWRLFAR